VARSKSKMTPEHKAALAEGRALGRSVREYLEALEQHKPKRGRKRTPESIKKRLATIAESLPEASPIRKVELIQERRDLEVELATMGTKVDLTAVEKGFVKAAKQYSERKGISYATWREAGVPAEVLKKAGISRGGA
jgi:thiamine biosynthesis lipoprotein ApbE